MKHLTYLLICLLSFSGFAQETQETQEAKETQEIEEEFLPVVIGDKEAFLSTKTGEYIYRSHEKTNPEELVTTQTGVVYTDISTHTVKKGETLSSISKKHALTIDALKRDNKMKSSNLSIGQKLKIKKISLVESSSPVISYAGEERIVARLRPGQSPQGLNVPGEAPNAIGPKVITPQPGKSIKKNIEEDDEDMENSESLIEEASEMKVEEASEIKEEEIEIKSTVVNVNEHIVRKGDTLFGIAKQYNITVQKLKEINNLAFNNLSIGQKLKLQ